MAPEIDVEMSGVVGFEAVTEMVVGGAKEACASIAALDARIEDVAAPISSAVGSSGSQVSSFSTIMNPPSSSSSSALTT